ncbi:MAG: hypothetical protein Q8L48_22120 [Archangium sp.]|nr:hypothetical protein [Archangium sp.]
MLLLVALLLLWKETLVSPLIVLLAFSVLAALGTFHFERREIPRAGPLLSLASLCAAAGGYSLSLDVLALVALAIGTGTFASLAWLHAERGGGASSAHRLLVFQGFAWSGLLFTMAASFHLFHASGFFDVQFGGDRYVARRLVMTLLWLTPGLWFVVHGSKREDGAIAGAGVVLVVAALAKLLLYDTTHLHGPLRIAAFGLSGLLTMLGGRLLAPGPRPLT